VVRAADAAVEAVRDWDAAADRGWAGAAAIAPVRDREATAFVQNAGIKSRMPSVSAVWIFHVPNAGRAWYASEVA